MVATIIILAILLVLSVFAGMFFMALFGIVLVTMEEHRRNYFDRVKNMFKKGAPKVYEIIDNAMEDNFPEEKFDEILKKYEE